MIDRWYPSGNRPLQAISGLHCRARRVMVSSSIRLTAWLQNSKKWRNGQRDWCMSRVTAIISALVICIIVRLSWAVNHYRDNAITYKSPARQKCQRIEAGERGKLLTRRCQRDVVADAKYTKELADAKAEMKFCVMMLPLVVVGCTSAVCRQCVKPPPPPAWIMQLSDWQTPLNGIISPSGELITIKQLEGTQKYIKWAVDRVAHIDWATHAIIVSNTHALPAEYKCLK